MRTVDVETSSGSYQVHVGFGNSDSEMDRHDFLLIDSEVARLRGYPQTSRSFKFSASEEAKTLGTCESALSSMNQKGFGKDDSLLAIGGGATQDIATLCASLYMRGVAWTYAPTTAMAVLDSCIGGKSAINLGRVKNLVGNIYPPTRIVVDLSFMKTLDDTALISGLCEAVKICFAAGRVSFDRYLAFNLAPSGFLSPANEDGATSFVAHVLDSKRIFIEKDEFDKAERRLLNFGHTFAHALESASSYEIPHGVAVGFGMVAALRHPRAGRNEQTLLLDGYLRDLLCGTPSIVEVSQAEIDWELFKRLIASDKKASRDDLRLVLPESSGGLMITEVPRNETSFEVLQVCMMDALASVSA